MCVCACESGRAGQQGGVCPHWGRVLAQCAQEWLHKYVCLQLHGAPGSSPCQYFLHTSFDPFCFSSRCCGTEEPANLAPVPTHSTRLFIILALLSRALPTLVSILMKSFSCFVFDLNWYCFTVVIICLLYETLSAYTFS